MLCNNIKLTQRIEKISIFAFPNILFMKTKKLIIGRYDEADFPLLNQQNIPVKVDSGAYTSSIHCYNATEVEEEGKKVLRCYFYHTRSKNYTDGIVDFEKYTTKLVKSSNGESQERFSIKTKIKIFGRLYAIDLTLAKRTKMKYNVLLGRKFLNNKFLIDTTKKNLSKDNLINYIAVK